MCLDRRLKLKMGMERTKFLACSLVLARLVVGFGLGLALGLVLAWAWAGPGSPRLALARLA